MNMYISEKSEQNSLRVRGPKTLKPLNLIWLVTTMISVQVDLTGLYITNGDLRYATIPFILYCAT